MSEDEKARRGAYPDGSATAPVDLPHVVAAAWLRTDRRRRCSGGGSARRQPPVTGGGVGVGSASPVAGCSKNYGFGDLGCEIEPSLQFDGNEIG
jgi:hypothetical protein